ncbi:MAG: alkaline phosphatase [Spirochaetales bacterium]|nr:alkaline phosphatase [Spirochaetales bacterium]
MEDPSPVSIIFCIGDGMGDEQIKAASLYLTGEEGNLSFHNFPVQGKVSTYSADSSITDSAASATAMATGQKVNNGVISQAFPGDGGNLPTILEAAQNAGLSTGLVTTAALTHATPAAFAAHTPNRNNYGEIGRNYLETTRPSVMLGGGGSAYGLEPESVRDAGYTLLPDKESLNVAYPLYTPLAGLFAEGHLPYEYDGAGESPHLSDMTMFALNYLDQDTDGFFLMVEGARIDHACHDNDLTRSVYETLEFHRTVNAIIDWADGREDVLVIVTADHETGGLSVLENRAEGILPAVSWSTDYHTGVAVSYFVWGEQAGRFTGLEDNTDYRDRMLSLIW